MKVIKPGIEKKGWAAEFTCTGKGNGNGGCGAVLLVEYRDLYKTYSSCMGETESSVTFCCACCEVETDISYSGPNSHDIPDKPRSRSRSRSRS